MSSGVHRMPDLLVLEIVSADECQIELAGANSWVAQFHLVIVSFVQTATAMLRTHGLGLEKRRLKSQRRSPQTCPPAQRPPGSAVAMTPSAAANSVFTTGGEAGLAGFTKFKAEFDERMLAELRRSAAAGDDPEKVALERWVIHDIRRTARSLISRAGVPPDHAERCLGHVIGGVRGIYDRHAFSEEKRTAFEALAGQVERILQPAANMVPLRPAGKTG
jgi:hypothetical protein